MEEQIHQHLYTCLGEVVNTRRKRLKMSQKELADKAGIDRVYLSNVEHGKSKPSFGTVAGIAQGLKLRYSRLVGECEECMKKTA